jgi:hypothetical protein
MLRAPEEEGSLTVAIDVLGPLRLRVGDEERAVTGLVRGLDVSEGERRSQAANGDQLEDRLGRGSGTSRAMF